MIRTVSVIRIACFALVVFLSGLHVQGDLGKEFPEPDRQELYFGQTPPQEKAEPFAPDVLIHEPHDSPVIAPDEKWLLFQGMEADLMFYGMKSGRLTAMDNPLGVEFPKVCNGVALSPSGERFYIEEWKDGRNHLFYIDRKRDQWSSPSYVDLGGEGNWWQISISSNGNLYFSRDAIMVSSIVDGSHVKPVPLKLEDGSDMMGMSPFISPDESYIICSIDGDLHISYRISDGKWTKPVDLGPNINSDQLELCPQITSNGKYLIFNTRRNFPQFAIYWADASFVEALRPKK